MTSTTAAAPGANTYFKSLSSVRFPAGPAFPAVPAQKPHEGLWKSLLENASRTAEFQKSVLLVLGSRDVGKSSIIRGLQRTGGGVRALMEMETYGESSGVASVDYAYMNVRAVDDADIPESLTVTDIVIVQEAEHKKILSTLISPDDLRHLVVMICLDLSEPWNFKVQLRFWLDFASRFVFELLNSLPPDIQDAVKLRLHRYISSYRSKVSPTNSNSDALEDAANTLGVNLGVPFIVCVCKSDCAVNLDTRENPGRTDVVLAHLRHLCLAYGAALVYCSTKTPATTRNIELLYRYILHRIYDFKFTHPAQLTSPDSIFIPSGWDTESEIQQFAQKTIAEGLETPLETLLTTPKDAIIGTYQSDDNSSVVVPTLSSFLDSLIEKDASLLVKERSTVAAVAVSAKPSRPPGVSSPPVQQKYQSKSGRTGLSTRSSTGAGTAAAAAKQQVDAQQPKGDSESLRAFFQNLLAKPAQGGAAARPLSPRSAAQERRPKPEEGGSGSQDQ